MRLIKLAFGAAVRPSLCKIETHRLGDGTSNVSRFVPLGLCCWEFHPLACGTNPPYFFGLAPPCLCIWPKSTGSPRTNLFSPSSFCSCICPLSRRKNGGGKFALSMMCGYRPRGLLSNGACGESPIAGPGVRKLMTDCSRDDSSRHTHSHVVVVVVAWYFLRIMIVHTSPIVSEVSIISLRSPSII